MILLVEHCDLSSCANLASQEFESANTEIFAVFFGRTLLAGATIRRAADKSPYIHDGGTWCFWGLNDFLSHCHQAEVEEAETKEAFYRAEQCRTSEFL